ncbi:hypothetical protein BD769DRAFT_1358600, partial [Suillus cothurnatus]
KSTLHLVIHLRGGMQIFVKTLTGKTMTLVSESAAHLITYSSRGSIDQDSHIMQELAFTLVGSHRVKSYFFTSYTKCLPEAKEYRNRFFC